MDNSNLDANATLESLRAPAGEERNAKNSSTNGNSGKPGAYQTQNSPAPSVGSYPAAMGAMEPSMPGMAGMPDAYPNANCMTAGFPAAGMQGMGYRTAGTPMTGLPMTGMAGTGLAAAGMPSAMQPMTPAMPGMPTGISAAEATGLAPLTPFNQPIPVTTESTLYINGFLRTMIGRSNGGIPYWDKYIHRQDGILLAVEQIT